MSLLQNISSYFGFVPEEEEIVEEPKEAEKEEIHQDDVSLLQNISAYFGFVPGDTEESTEDAADNQTPTEEYADLLANGDEKTQEAIGLLYPTWSMARVKAICNVVRQEAVDWYSEHTSVTVMFLFFILIVGLVWRRRTKQKNKRLGSRFSSGRELGNRPRSSSRDNLLSRDRKGSVRNRERLPTEDAMLMDDLLLDTADGLADLNEASYEVLGPSAKTLPYNTWSPPPSWTEASRQIVPKVKKHQIQREVQIEVASSKLNLGTTPDELQNQNENLGGGGVLSVQAVSIHVKEPIEGGVLEFNIKEPHKNERWMEHTFESAQLAAQFQQDLLGCQVVGPQIQNMFAALALVNSGSIATEGKEFVLHDTQTSPPPEEGEKKDEEAPEILQRGVSGVAWDDAMRCFSGIPSVREALEKQQEYYTQVYLWRDDAEETEPSALTPLYEGKRLMLGPVDFFRLFVSELPSTALPNCESKPSRMEQLLTWRKRVARASILVTSFVRAMKVVNQGWVLGTELPQGSDYLQRRLAFDDDGNNSAHDAKHTNEYYEGTVSRDVRCDVHTAQHLTKKGSSSPSPFQSYSLVGCHCFQLPPKGVDHPLLHDKDPVRALPSLRRIIESNPDVEFFVSGFFPEGPRIAIILLFCRSLPKGVDKAFDVALERYVKGSKKARDRKMEVFMQLGPGSGLSPLAWAALKTFSALLSWTRRGEAEIPRESGGANVRTPFPGMTMSNYTTTTHFGGALQRINSMPRNYVAVTSHVDGEEMSNMAARVLYQRLEDGALPASVVDFSFVIEGLAKEELPERVMATVRLVRINPAKVALPVSYSSMSDDEDNEALFDSFDSATAAMMTPRASSPPSSRASMWSQWVSFRTSFRSRSGEPKEKRQSYIDERDLVLPARVDVSKIGKPYRSGVQALWEILYGVTVPVRRESLSPIEAKVATEEIMSLGTTAKLPASIRKEDVVNLAVLRRVTAFDLQRYLIATDGDLKTAAVRVVESSAWRGVTFPIDTRACRIELQAGQFFQQGRDRRGFPVFYFQNMCLGPWRKDVDAVIAAVVHRLETCLRSLSKDEPKTQCTVVLLMGRPFHTVKSKKVKKKQSEEEENADTDEGSSWNPFAIGNNPRIDPEEEYYIHTNPALINKLNQLLSRHYPERLSKVLVVPGKGGSGYLGMSLGGSLGLRAYVPDPNTRAKIIILNSTADLLKYIDEDELTSFVGGKAEISPAAFECSDT